MGAAASRWPRRPRACPHAFPSSCGRASRPGRHSCRPFSRSSTVAPARSSTFPLLPAAQVRRGATRRRSRSRRRRGRRSPRRTESPGSASPTSEAGASAPSPQRSPSVAATCTRCTASTTSPPPHGYPDRVHRKGLRRCRSCLRSKHGGVTRPACQEVTDREGRAGAHRHAEDHRTTASALEGEGSARRRAACEAVPAAFRRRRARGDGAPDERGPTEIRRSRAKGAKTPIFRLSSPTEASCSSRRRARRSAPECGSYAGGGRGRARNLGPEATRSTSRTSPDPRVGFAAPSFAAARPAADRRHRARVGERDPLGSQLSPYALSTQVDAAEVERLAEAITRRWSAASSCGSPGRTTRDYRVHNALGEPCRAAAAARPRRLRGAHDLLLPAVPDRGPRTEGPALSRLLK